VVTDEKLIADSLLRFETVMKAMSSDEQKELVQLIEALAKPLRGVCKSEFRIQNPGVRMRIRRCE
jgi:hypothetical protein